MAEIKQIEIVLDSEDSSYKTGERVSGRVIITPQKDLSPNGILVELLWMAHGKGNSFSHSVDKLGEKSLPMKTGLPVTLPFHFTLPLSPVSYRGTLLNVDYYVRATVDISWAIDPVKSHEIIVVPREGANYQPFELSGMSFKKGNVVQMSLPAKIAIGLVGVLFLYLLSGPLIFIAVGVLIWWIMRAYAESILGKVVIDHGDEYIVPGTSKPINVSFTPGKTVNLKGIYLDFIAEESVTSGSGKHSRTYTHVLHKERIQLCGILPCQEKVPKSLSFDLKIPEVAAYSLDVSNNHVRWSLNFHFDIPDSPDWNKYCALKMIPAGVKTIQDQK